MAITRINAPWLEAGGSVVTVEQKLDGLPISVLDYGATGDGTTDDTAAIQDALDAAESDTNAVKSVFAPAGKYLVDTIYVPLGVTLYGEGGIETTARYGTTFIQSTAGADVIRVKSLQNGSLYYWYGRMHSFTILGDTSQTAGFGINLKDSSGNLVNLQDSSIIRDITVRRMYQGGVNFPTGAFPCTIGPMKLLFNNGPGITFTRTTVCQALHFLDISGDGNNGGLIALNSLNDGWSSVAITNLKSEARVNADYGSAEHQNNAIVCTNCDGAAITINGASHTSSIPDGGNYKKPGDFITLTGTLPKIAWSGVSIRVRGTDTGTDPKVIGGITAVAPSLYTDAHGFYNSPVRLLSSAVQYFRKNNTDLDTTPSVAGTNLLLVTNSGSTTITNFDDGLDGQLLVVSFQDSNTTVSDNANIILNGTFTSTGNDTLTLVKVSTGWREIARSAN